MKRLLVLSIAALFVLSTYSYSFAEQKYPKGYFYLFGGRIKPKVVSPESDPRLLALKTAVSSMVITVSSGAVEGESDGPIDFVDKNVFKGDHEKSFNTFSGKVKIKLSGDYDSDTGVFKGAYEIDGKISNKYTRWNTSFKEFREENFQDIPMENSGKFTGKVIDDIVYMKFLNARSSSNVIYRAAFQISSSSSSPSGSLIPLDEDDAIKDSGVRFNSLNGEIKVYLPGSDTWRLAKWDQELPVGTRIVTGENGTAMLSFADMSNWVMPPETEIIISAPPEKDSGVELVRGRIWANVKKMLKDGSMDIKMNQAVASIKGTTFVLKTGDKSDEIKVIEGLVSFGLKDGEKIDVKGGESASLSEGKLSKAFFSLEEEEKYWDDALNVDFSNMSKVPNYGTIKEASVDSSDKSPTEKSPSSSGFTNILVALIVLAATIFGFLFFKKKTNK